MYTRLHPETKLGGDDGVWICSPLSIILQINGAMSLIQGKL